MFLIISILSDDIFIKITKASKICNQFQIKWFDCLHLSNQSYELIIIQSEDGALKLVAHPTGLFTVSVCMMSNYSKSRVLSLQLLARLCDDAKVSGHRQVKWHLSLKWFSFEYNPKNRPKSKYLTRFISFHIQGIWCNVHVTVAVRWARAFQISCGNVKLVQFQYLSSKYELY